MKILITGIDGFLGTAIAPVLARDGHEIFGMSIGVPTDAPYRFFPAEVSNRGAVFAVFAEIRPDLCIHLAAMAHADVGAKDEWRVREVNVRGAINVADAAVEYGCSDFIYFSSAKVFGDTTGPEGVDEDEEPRPVGVYATLKREVELALLKRSAAGKLKVAVLRPVAVIGRGDTKGNYARLAKAVRSGFFPLLDGGAARRSLVFQDRVAECVRMLVSHGIEPGSVYVLSDGAFTLGEIVDAVRSAVGFAWCPHVSSGWLRRISSFVDGGFAALGKPVPIENALKRLTGSFVVNAHRFDEALGSRPPVDLGLAMIDAYGPGQIWTDTK